MRPHVTVLSLICSVCMFFPESVADDEKKPEKPNAVTLNGVFEAIQSSELSAGTEKLTALKIRRIVPHGTFVRQGQTLVWFETDDIDEKIEAADVNLRLAKLTLQEAEFNFEQFRKTQELDRSAAENTRRAARQAHDNYVRVDRDRSVASAEFNLKNSRASFENALEELKQLEQMYKEDELTEESEEIVLKRAKHTVENAKFYLQNTELQTKRTLTQSIPRQNEQHEDKFTRAELAYQKSIRSLELARQRQDIEMKQKRDKFQKEQDDLKAMQSERAKLTITAPHDGIAYHGALVRGKLSDKPSSLEKESAVTNKQILITLVNPERLQIRTELTEALLDKVTAGKQGTATPNAFTERALATRVKSAGTIPFANNQFDCVLTIGKGNIRNVVPGMTCVVKLPEKKPAAEKK